MLLKLEALQEKQIDAALKPEKAPVTLDDAEREAALELLLDPRLLDRILADFERSGIVGEEPNKLVGYLACVSRKLERPLAVIIQSTSAAGKSALMGARGARPHARRAATADETLAGPGPCDGQRAG